VRLLADVLDRLGRAEIAEALKITPASANKLARRWRTRTR